MGINENKFGENLLWFLDDYAMWNADDVEGPEIEIYGEDENGMEGSCTVNTIELAGEAAKEIRALIAQRDKALEKLETMECQAVLADKPVDEETHTNYCALKSINDDQVRKVIRAFWRRIYPYRNDYGIELPTPMPVEFMAHMATALTWVDNKDKPAVAVPDGKKYYCSACEIEHGPERDCDLCGGQTAPSHSQQSVQAESVSREELARQFKAIAAESGLDNRWHPGANKEFFSDATQAAFDQYVADRRQSHESEQHSFGESEFIPVDLLLKPDLTDEDVQSWRKQNLETKLAAVDEVITMLRRRQLPSDPFIKSGFCEAIVAVVTMRSSMNQEGGGSNG